MTGKIKLVHSGGNAVSIAVPTSNPSASEVEFKLPQADGTSGQALVTDSSGNLSFAGTGKILQVISTTKTDGFSASVGGSGTSSVITGLTVSITPSSTNNKILITAHISGVVSGSAWQYWSLTRGGSKLTGATGDQWGSNRSRNTIGGFPYGDTDLMNNFSFNYLDSPSSTSAQTYGVVYTNGSGSTQTVYINQGTAGDSTDRGSFTSTITAMEVAA